MKARAIIIVFWMLLHITATYAQALSVDFSFNNDNECSGVNVTFTPSVTGGIAPYTYDWNFGDGTAHSSSNIPIHSFISYGCGIQTFNITLKISYDSAQTTYSKSLSKQLTVKRKPESMLSDSAGGDFSNCSSSPPPSLNNPKFHISVKDITNSTCLSNNSYLLDWGDGTPKETPAVGFTNIAHTYSTLGAFPLTFTTKGTNGCQSSKTYIVKNEADPNGAIDLSGTYASACAPLPYQFVISGNNANSPGTIYDINFGDGDTVHLTHTEITSRNGLIIHRYSTSSCTSSYNVFNVVMNIKNSCGTGVAQRTTSKILAKPAAKVATNSILCVNKCITFLNLSTKGYGVNCTTNDTYKWDFGNGNLSDLKDPPCQTYTTPGNYIIKLTASNYCGDSIYILPITIDPLPVAIATADQTQGCVPLDVKFSNQSTGGTITSKWTISPTTGFNYINGTNNTSAEPTIQFIKTGSYNVTLNVANKCAQSAKSFTISVTDKQKFSFGGQSNFCEGATIQTGLNGFVSLDPNSLPITSYLWKGTPGITVSDVNIKNPNITVNNSGSFDITLDVTNACGITSLKRTVTVNKPVQLNAGGDTAICSNNITLTLIPGQTVAGSSWICKSPDPCPISGNSFSLSVPGSYVIQYYQQGCYVADEKKIIVTKSPVVVVGGASSVSICKTDTARIMLSATPDNGIWSGPGVSGQYFIPSGLAAGTYSLKYTVSDPLSSCQGIGTKTINILAAPNAAFTATGTLCANQLITFTNSGNVTNLWNYNDPGINWVTSNSHTYSVPGSYKVEHKVSAGTCSETASINIDVKPGTPVPQFTVLSNTGCEPYEVPFTDITDSTSLYTDFSSKWYVDGILISNWYKPPIITLTKAGKHGIKWELSNQCNSQVKETQVTVNVSPVADFSINSIDNCSPVNAKFINLSTGDNYEWYIDGKNTAIDPAADPSYVFSSNTQTTHEIRLVAKNGCGINEITKNFTVYPGAPNPQFTLLSNSECEPFTVSFASSMDSSVLYQDFSSKWYKDGVHISDWYNPPVIIFTEPGKHTILWKLANSCGSKEMLSNIEVNAKPFADFDIDNINDCSPAEVKFINRSLGDEFSWYIDGNNTIIDPVNPNYTFITYNVLCGLISQRIF